jgi:hypothetical protein
MFKSKVAIAAHPDARLLAHCDPMSFEVGGECSLSVTTGRIEAHFSEVPITMRIPFLRRGGGRVVAASIGPFGVRLDPIEAHVRAADVSVRGVVGTEGLKCVLQTIGACKAEFDISGKLPAMIFKTTVEGADEH